MGTGPSDLLDTAKDLFVAANSGGGHDEKEGPRPEGDGGQASRGKLAERIEVEFGPFRPAASR